MNINRDNYEEFFILYGDNELGNEDRISVESFVKDNPDLAGEFAMLNQLRFSPDELVSFDNKESLLQDESSAISSAHKLMLLSIDQEISAAGKAELEQLLARDASMRTELEYYTRTKSDPADKIVYPWKQSLYRTEEKAKVVAFAWRRFAAAAAILLAVSVTALIFFNKKESGNGPLAGGNTTTQQSGTSNEVAATGNGATQKENAAGSHNNGSAADQGSRNNGLATQEPDKATKDQSAQQRIQALPGTENNALAQHEANPSSGGRDKVSTVNNNAQQGAVAKNRKEVKQLNADPLIKSPAVNQEQIAKTHNNLPKPVNNPNVMTPSPEKEMIASVQKPAQENKVNANQKNTAPAVTSDIDNPSQYAAYRPADLDDETGDQGSSSKKSKLRGFFRKVTRTFEKNTNIKATDEEDRLLLGGLAIRL